MVWVPKKKEIDYILYSNGKSIAVFPTKLQSNPMTVKPLHIMRILLRVRLDK